MREHGLDRGAHEGPRAVDWCGHALHGAPLDARALGPDAELHRAAHNGLPHALRRGGGVDTDALTQIQMQIQNIVDTGQARKYKYKYKFKISIQFWSRRDNSVVPLA
jgi:hypothetical protein